jgi:hypothetical protein
MTKINRLDTILQRVPAVGVLRPVIDPKTEHFVDNPEAMKLYRRETYRKPRAIGDEV